VRPRFGVVSLGVADPGRARAFYEALGWRASEGEGGLVLLVGNAVLSLGPGPRARILHQVRARADVAALLARADSAGGRVLAAAAESPWGAVAGAFADPDGNVWEVEHDPELPPDEIVSLRKLADGA
jgi:catechol 2,3-dioxygenase-like lactoylglutathione lyase family enzyme